MEAKRKMVVGMFRNRDFRRLVFFATLIVVFFVAVLFITLSTLTNTFVADVIERDTAVIGRLVSDHPELKDHIAAAFSSTVDEEFYEEGLKAAASLGYTKKIVSDTGFLKRNMFQNILKTTIICVIIFLIFFLVVYITLNRVFKRMKLMSQEIEKVMDGKINTRLPEDMEGDFAILCDKLNQLISRMNSLIEKLQLEKDSIKCMMSNMSHQMKTPITSLKMFNEILERDGHNEEVRKEFVERNNRLIERIEKLVENLLKYSKMHSGVINLDVRKGNISNVLSEMLEELEPVFKSRKQKVITKLDDVGESFFDPEWLYEALENIIKNASDYTVEGNTIEIDTFKDIEGIKIKVKDTGMGISQEDKERIFEPFYRGRIAPDNKNTDKNQRTGIGLALTKLLIEKHNGYITIDTTPGKGSVFTVVLP